MSDSIFFRASRANRLIRPQSLALVALFAALFFSASALAQTMGTASLNTERRGHSATLLQDGNVLIVGGENQNGIVSQAEILDPASLSSAPVPAAAPARTDHAASLLQDGRVLVSGGRDENAELASTQIYDPSTGDFSSGPSMMRARTGHTATRLSDGRILMTGGDASGSAEIYDPATESFSLVTGSLNTARKYHSAILLHNEQVLIVGGIDAQNTILNTGEVFEPQVEAFYSPVNALEIPRALATLRILPDGKVQVIGGDSDFSMEIFDPELGNFNAVAYLPPAPDYLGATLSTRSRAALVSPSASQNPNMLGIPLSSELLDLLDRADQTITELPSRNQALVAGGVNSAGQVLNSATLVQSSPATITTEKTDYAPGEFVIITGTGFQPNEDIAMILHERPDEYDARLTFEATADSQGNFMYGEFAPDIIDIGRTFTLTATGQSSGLTAQTVFTDAPRVGSVTVGAQSPNPVTAGNSASYTITVNRGSGAGSAGAFSANLSVTTPLPTEATASFSPSSVSFSACAGPTQANNPTHACNQQTATLTISTATSTPGGSTNFTVRATNTETSTDSAEGNGTLAVTPACAAPSITTHPSNQTITYGQNASFSAAASGDPTPTVKWQVSTDNGANWNDISGAHSTTLNVIAPTVAMSGNQYRAVFTNDCGGTQTATTNTATLTVNQKPASVTPDGASKTYGDDDPVFTGTLTGFLDGDGVTATYSRTAGEIVGSYTISASLSPAGVLGNYDITYNTATFTISKKDASVVALDNGKTYGEDDPTLTGTLTGFLEADGITATYARAPGEDVGDYVITPTLVDPNGKLGNYNVTSTNGTFTIMKRPITVTADPQTKVYGEDDPALTYQITSGSLAFSDYFIGPLSRVAGESVGEYDITQGTLSINNIDNYNLTFVGAKLTITKRPITVTADPQTKIMGAPDPELTYFVSYGSLVAGDSFTGGLVRDPGEDAGPYEIKQGTLSINNIANYVLTYVHNYLTITYAPEGLACYGAPGHQILQPIAPNGSSVFKRNSTVPAKFRVCDFQGNSIGTPGVVSGFYLIQITHGTSTTEAEDTVDSTTPDTTFRWSSSEQQWIFNISTKNLQVNRTYVYRIDLKDGTSIYFQYGMK